MPVIPALIDAVAGIAGEYLLTEAAQIAAAAVGFQNQQDYIDEVLSEWDIGLKRVNHLNRKDKYKNAQHDRKKKKDVKNLKVNKDKRIISRFGAKHQDYFGDLDGTDLYKDMYQEEIG